MTEPVDTEEPAERTDGASVSADARKAVTRVLAERGDAIVSDSVAIFPYNGPQPLETDYCERLGRRLLGLLSASIEGRLPVENDGLIELQRLVLDRGLPMQRLFSFVYLMERTVLDEIALDPSLGATSEAWPQVAQIIRRGSFDLLAAYCERSQQESPAPTISDKLTTLYSRAMMDIVLSTEVQRAERFSFPIAFAVFDVDGLSDLNQNYGYGVGDRLLERLGILIRKFFRENDWVFRHGEDSIAVLLCQVSPEDAFFLTSRVVAMVEQRLGFKDHNTDDRVRVTVSAALITGQGSLGEPFDAERLLLEADAGMKRAKSLGRNRVETTALAASSLSVQNAARYLHCTPATVQKLIAEGKLKATGAGQATRIPKLAVEDYRNAKVLDIRPPRKVQRH
ncbi:MAG TPA: diguanylate cyclase [Vicinamibacterales bacterium]|jgi:diguanylate cyclase (GGDEF)-like protein/excisionase family DNA binding protein|nr:diguanylate cyclase [Vicinamibacterales bacterium]